MRGPIQGILRVVPMDELDGSAIGPVVAAEESTIDTSWEVSLGQGHVSLPMRWPKRLTQAAVDF